MSQGYQAYSTNPSTNQYPPYGPPPTVVVAMPGGNKCPFCGELTGNIPRATCGLVACLWGICLAPWFLFWVPCCVDGCQDHELVCPNCNGVKNVIPATCC